MASSVSPTVSVVVVVRNEADRIRSCLDQLLAQDYPRELLEIVLIDNMSTDGTAEIAESFSDKIAVSVLKIAERGRSQGLNRGIQEAKGEVIVRVDARTVIKPDYVSRCINTLLKTGADNVGGVRKPLATNETQEAIGMALSHPFGIGSGYSRLGTRSGYVDSVYLGCFRREVFDKVGLFDETAAVINEDWDLNYRIRAAGGKVYLDADIAAFYYPRESFADLCRLYFRYGGARVGNLRKHGRIASWRYIVAPAFVLAIVFGSFLSIKSSAFGYATLALVTLYCLADFFVSSVIAYRARRPTLLPKLILAFPCMHLSWGLGFWKRLLVPRRPGTYWGY